MVITIVNSHGRGFIVWVSIAAAAKATTKIKLAKALDSPSAYPADIASHGIYTKWY